MSGNTRTFRDSGMPFNLPPINLQSFRAFIPFNSTTNLIEASYGHIMDTTNEFSQLTSSENSVQSNIVQSPNQPM